MAKCKQCNQEYEAKRSTSSYCSPKCKQEFYRNRMSKRGGDVIVTCVTEGLESVTVKTLLSEDVTKCIGTVPVTPPIIEVKPERTTQGNIRVSKPGDADYVPQCETTRAFIEGRPKAESGSKRGLDIKYFEDLPLDVQQTIDRISESNEEKRRRTGIAIRYQHLFPDRYYSTGVMLKEVMPDAKEKIRYRVQPETVGSV